MVRFRRVVDRSLIIRDKTYFRDTIEEERQKLLDQVRAYLVRNKEDPLLSGYYDLWKSDGVGYRVNWINQYYDDNNNFVLEIDFSIEEAKRVRDGMGFY